MKITVLQGIANTLEAAAQVFRAADSVSFDLAQATSLANKGNELVGMASTALQKLKEGGIVDSQGNRWLNLRKED